MFLWWATAGLLDRQTDAAIEADAQSLAERYDEAGLPALVLTIEDRLTQDVEDDAIYLLVDPAGQRIAGNLQHWPQGAARNGDWYELPIERAGMRSLALVQSLRPARRFPPAGRPRRAGARAVALAADRRAVVGAAGGAGDGHRRRAGGAQPVPPHAGQCLGHRRGDRGRRLHPAGADCPAAATSSTSSPRRSTTCWTASARLMEGVREVSNAIAHDLRTPITRARARLEDAVGACRRRPRTCAPRSSGRPPTSTASSRCSRRCCASPRSRPARVARPSPRSTWRRCSPMWPSCTGRWPRRTASR